LQTQKIEVYFDGLCQPYNPGGIACYAFVIKKDGYNNNNNNDDDDETCVGQTIYSQYGLAAEPFTNDASNNVAEYMGIIKALEWLLLLPQLNDDNNKIIVRGDSKLVVYQTKGKYKVKASRIVPLHQTVMSLISKFKVLDIEWVPREQNMDADRLSNKAYQEFLENNSALRERISEYLATDEQLELLKNLGIKPDKYLSKMEAYRTIKNSKTSR
jgi:ribonuclease HI